MSKSKGRRLAEWLRNLDSNSKAASNTLADDSVGSDQLAHDLALQGNPTAATQSSGNSSTRLATTAFVATEVAALVDSAPGALNTLNELAAAVNDDASFSTTITNSIALKAPLASPALTGTPTAPTASSGTNTTQLATTAFVTAATSGLATDTNLANKAPINSPTFTGTPAAPTASAGTNTTQIATTAFVTAAVAAGGGGVDGISSSADATAITIDSSEAVAIGGSTFIGSRAKSLSVVGDDNSSPIAAKTTSYDTVFSVLPWSASTTYIGTGTYYDDGVWVHASDNTKNSLLALTGDGVHWYASTNSGSSFDAASNVPLWNASGQWDGDINTTYDINTGKLTITNANYDNHLELNRSSEQWRFSPSTDGSLDIRRVGGTGTAVVDILSNTTVDGTLNVSSVPAGSANWRPIIFNDGGTLASNASVEIHGSLGYLTAVYLNMTHAVSTRNSDTQFYSSTDGYLRKNTAAGMKSSLGLTAAGYVDTATGNYGTVKVNDDRSVSWAGYAIRDDWVFMSNGAGACGIYNDTDNEWAIKITRNAQTSLYHNGTQVAYTYASGWRVTGNLLATQDVYAYYSDERLKDKTGKIENALDKVGAIETFYYTHNDKAIELGYEDKKQQVGVSAQSVEAVMPEVVHLAPIDDDGEGNSVSGEDYKTVNYARLVPLLIESIKELRAEVEELKRG